MHLKIQAYALKAVKFDLFGHYFFIFSNMHSMNHSLIFILILQSNLYRGTDCEKKARQIVIYWLQYIDGRLIDLKVSLAAVLLYSWWEQVNKQLL